MVHQTVTQARWPEIFCHRSGDKCGLFYAHGFDIGVDNFFVMQVTDPFRDTQTL